MSVVVSPCFEISIGSVIEEFQSYNLSVNKSSATLKWHAAALKQFEGYFGGGVSFDQISTKQVDAYRLHLFQRGLALESVNNYLRSLRALVRWAYDRGFIGRLPKVEFMRTGPPLPKPVFNGGEFAALVEAAGKESTELLRVRAVAILLFLYDTGVRASELCNARIGNITHPVVEGVTGHVLVVEGAKRGGPREVPLHEETWQAIQRYREELGRPHGRGLKKTGSNPAWLFTSGKNLNDPLTVAGLRRMCERLERHCSVHANPHKFRHSFATAWINESEGKEIDTLMEVAGWKTKEMVRVYGSYRTATLVKAHRRNGPFAGKVATPGPDSKI